VSAKAREAAFGLDKLGITGSSPVPPMESPTRGGGMRGGRGMSAVGLFVTEDGPFGPCAKVG
jgi:hypothetical protein